MDNLSKINSQNIIQKDSKGEIVSLIVLAILSAGLWQFEIGRYILYPFTILGTWFHEMSHGIAAMILGANFERLELNSDGSGLAVYSGGVILGGIGKAIVAAAGPLGPAIFGSIMIISSSKTKYTRFFLFFLLFLLVISALFWIRTIFGLIFALVFVLVLSAFLKKGSQNSLKLLLQFLGVQAIMSVYLSVDYLFSKGGSIGVENYYSDTQVMQNELFLPYWFWGGFLLISCMIMLVMSLKFIYSRK